MVKLILNNREQQTFLEDALIASKIPYEVEIIDVIDDDFSPYLIVDGVTLDFYASITYVADHNK